MARSTGKLLLSASALRTTNLAAQVVVSFFLTPFVIRSLGDRLNGFWALVGTFIGYYGLMELGLGTAVSRHIAGALGKGDREQGGRVFTASVALYSVLGAILMILTGIIAPLSHIFVHSPQDAHLFSKVILVLGLSVGISFPVRAYGGLLTAELRFDVLVATDFFSLLLRTGLVVAVLLAGGKVLALAWVTFLAGLPRTAIYIFASRKLYPWLRLRASPWFSTETKRLLSYSAYAFVSDMADRLRFNIDAFVIAGIVGLSAVTHFNIAAVMVTYFMNLMIALMGVIGPWFSRVDGAGDHATVAKGFLFATKLSICASSFVGFGLAVWGKAFISRWMGAPYLDAYPCLLVLALGYTVALWQIPSGNLLFAISKHKFYALANVIEGLANLGLSLWLARSLGIFGVALGTFVPMLAMKLIIQPIYVCRVASIPLAQYAREVARSLLVVALALIVPVVIAVRFVVPNYYALMGVALTSLICYLAVIGSLQFTSNELALLRQVILPVRFNRTPAASTAMFGKGR